MARRPQAKFNFRTGLKFSSRLSQKLKNSDQDNLDNTYIEYSIFALWKIDIVNLINTKAGLIKNFSLPPSELDRMPMWEYEMLIRSLNEFIKEENDQNKSEMEKYDINKYQKMVNPNNISKMMKGSTPQLPKMPKF